MPVPIIEARSTGARAMIFPPPAASTAITRQDRERLQGHPARAVWLTGLSGKTTLAHALETSLHHDGLRTFVLDGDRLRAGLSSDLGFTDADRAESSAGPRMWRGCSWTRGWSPSSR